MHLQYPHRQTLLPVSPDRAGFVGEEFLGVASFIVCFIGFVALAAAMFAPEWVANSFDIEISDVRRYRKLFFLGLIILAMLASDTCGISYEMKLH